MKVIKRDGREVDFNANKIEKAILKSFIAVDEIADQYAMDKASNIAAYIENYAMKEDRVLTIDEIQDLVEKGLMSTKRKDVARAYITYRNERDKERNKNSQLRKKVREKLKASNTQQQNANVDEKSFGGRIGEASSEQMRDIAINELLSPLARDRHLNNEIYIHDLDSYAVGMHNCLTIPFDDIFAKGFNTRQTDVRPANSINTMLQLLAVVFQLQSLQQFGGVSASHLDWTAVPYIRKSFFKHYLMEYLKSTEEFFTLNLMEMSEDELDDWVKENKQRYLDTWNLKEEDFKFDNEDKLDKKFYQQALYETRKETYQAVEGMYHNLNTLQSRSGNQLPFTSINYGTCTLPEGRMFIKAILEGSKKGVGKFHKTSIFPCGIFQCMKGVNRDKEDPNYDLFRLALESTATRLYPNYANVDWSGNAGFDRTDPCTFFSTMGCRTANGWDVNGLGQRKDGRGNICPVTIILPTLAMQASEYYNVLPCGSIKEDTIEVFMQILDKAIDDARDMLIERFDWICSQDAAAAKFMYENGLMAGYVPEEGIRSALKHGTLAIGQLGLAETLQILIGKDHTSEEGMELAKRIEALFQKKCKEFKEEYSLNFGVYFTPAENLCYTAMKKFKDKYGEIPNVSDKKFFTNSMHVPVWIPMSPFEKIDIESQLTGYSSAGCITYVELEGGIKNNLDALETIVSYAMDKDIPYFAINVPNDMCMDCGYTDEINDVCPMCGGRRIRRLRRVTGYLTGDYQESFNEGKQEETDMRVKHG